MLNMLRPGDIGMGSSAGIVSDSHSCESEAMPAEEPIAKDNSYTLWLYHELIFCDPLTQSLWSLHTSMLHTYVISNFDFDLFRFKQARQN